MHLFWSLELQWQLFRKLFQVSRTDVVVALVVVVFSRLTKFFSFLLPFKALIVAVSPSVRLNINASLSVSGIELSFILAGLSIISFVIYLAIRKIPSRIFLSLSSSQAYLDVFGGLSQKDISERRFHDAITCVALLFLVFALFSAVGYFSWTIAIIVFLSVAFVSFRVANLSKKDSSDKPSASTSSQFEKYSYSVQVGTLFLLIILSPDSTIQPSLAAVFIFVAVRQLLVYVSEVIKISASYGNSYSAALSNLPEVGATTAIENQVPVFLIKEKLLDWAKTIIKENDEGVEEVVSVQWRNLALKYLSSFNVMARCGGEDRYYIINAYQKRHRAYFFTERNFVSQEATRSLITSIRYLGAVESEQYCATIFRDNSRGACTSKVFKAGLTDFLCALWSLEPKFLDMPLKNDFIDQFARTKHRLIEMRVVASNPTQSRIVEKFLDKVERVMEVVSLLPLAIDSAELSGKTSVLSSSGAIEGSTWGRVCVEPIGSYIWRVKEKNALDLEKIASALSKSRIDCAGISADHLKVACFFYGLRKNIQNNHLSEALDCLLQLNKAYENLVRRLNC